MDCNILSLAEQHRLLVQWQGLPFAAVKKLAHKYPAIDRVIRLTSFTEMVSLATVAMVEAAAKFNSSRAGFCSFAWKKICWRLLQEADRACYRVPLVYHPELEAPSRAVEDPEDYTPTVERLLSRLTEMNREVVKSRFGIGTDRQTARSIASRLGVTPGAIQQRLETALRQMRRPEPKPEPRQPVPSPVPTPTAKTPTTERNPALNMLYTPQPADQPEPLLTVQQVAKILQVSVRSIWRMVEDGRLPADAVLRITGVTVRFDPRKIRDWLDSMRQPATVAS